MHNFSKQFLAILFSGSLIFNGALFAAQEQEQSVVSYRAVIEDFIKKYPLEIVGGSVLTTALISFLISALVARGKNKTIKELTVDKETAEKNITQLELQVTELQSSIVQNKTDLENQIIALINDVKLKTEEKEKLEQELQKMLDEIGSFESLKKEFQKVYFALARLENTKEDQYATVTLAKEEDGLATSVISGTMVDSNLENNVY